MHHERIIGCLIENDFDERFECWFMIGGGIILLEEKPQTKLIWRWWKLGTYHRVLGFIFDLILIPFGPVLTAGHDICSFYLTNNQCSFTLNFESVIIMQSRHSGSGSDDVSPRWEDNYEWKTIKQYEYYRNPPPFNSFWSAPIPTDLIETKWSPHPNDRLIDTFPIFPRNTQFISTSDNKAVIKQLCSR